MSLDTCATQGNLKLKPSVLPSLQLGWTHCDLASRPQQPGAVVPQFLMSRRPDGGEASGSRRASLGADASVDGRGCMRARNRQSAMALRSLSGRSQVARRLPVGCSQVLVGS